MRLKQIVWGIPKIHHNSISSLMEKCKKIKINNNFTLYEHRDDVNEYRYRQKDNLSHLRRIPKALFLNERVCEIIQPPEFNNRFKYKKSESMVLQSL